MEIVLVGVEQIEALSALFDQYRVFYEQSSDLEAARTFLRERLQNRDSVILTACEDGQIVGFTQLYPSFSSVSMKRIWILNDLFVVATHRRKGIARLLMETAKQYAQETGAVRIVLATKISNNLAQALYESLGYIKDEEFYHYSLSLL
jgi:ribosomal protein S18 acetylase RimI-like enzyme